MNMDVYLCDSYIVLLQQAHRIALEELPGHVATSWVQCDRNNNKDRVLRTYLFLQ